MAKDYIGVSCSQTLGLIGAGNIGSIWPMRWNENESRGV
jgi:hypothetical protein